MSIKPLASVQKMEVQEEEEQRARAHDNNSLLCCRAHTVEAVFLLAAGLHHSDKHSALSLCVCVCDMIFVCALFLRKKNL